MDDAMLELASELGRLPDEGSRDVFLARHAGLKGPQIVAELAAAVRAAVRTDVRKALQLSEAALFLARRQESEEAIALAERAKANALWFMGDCRSAVALFAASAARFARLGKPVEQARTLSSSLQSLILLGEYEEAFAAGAKARKIFAESGDAWRLARLDLNIANIFHRQNRYGEALAAYERAYADLLPFRDAEGIGVALHNMAVCLIALDDYARALATYARVRSFCQEQEMPLLVAQADYNVAFLYYLRGEYSKALDLLQATRATYRANGDSYHAGLCDLDRSEIYLELGLAEEAAEVAASSLEHFRQLGMNLESIRSLLNLAVAVEQRGDSERALELFAEARALAGGEGSRLWPQLIDLYRALVLLDAGESPEAGALALSAAEFFQGAGLPSKEALALLLRARADLQSGAMADAEARCQAAAAIAARLDAPNLLCQAYFLWGQTEENAGRPEQAYQRYQLARQALETLRSGLERPELKIGLMRSRLEVYTRLVGLCLGRGGGEPDAAEALCYVEEARSRSLRDLILQSGPGKRAPAAASETDARVRELRQELNWFYHRIELEQFAREAKPAGEVECLREEARRREQALMRLMLEAPVSAGIGAALRDSSAATVDQIRGALGADATLLEYFAVGGRMHAAVISRKLLKTVPLAATALVAERLRLLQFQLSKFRLSGEYVQRFRLPMQKATDSHLQALYAELIRPLEGLLETNDLVIVPFGPLHSLPFHALSDGRQALIDRHAICCEPSASIFAYGRQNGRAPAGEALVLGIEDRQIPLVRGEVDAVAAALPGARVLFGAEATEEALIEYGRASRSIHIASHGYFRQDSPMFSAIRLAGSYLTLYDLYHMDLPVELLALSGCVTGLNVVEQGDELLGLTRGLLYAGARSLLLSLWEVDDRSTAEFMGVFYRRLSAGERKADALRTATVAVRERYPHPYHWAPFKLIGNGL